MKRAVVALLLALGAGGAIWAYTYQGNTNAANDGRPYHSSLPVPWVFNDQTGDSLSNVSAGSDPKQAIRDGFAEWERESSFSTSEGADSTIDDSADDGVNLMTFADTTANRDRVGGVNCAFGPLAVTVLRWNGSNVITDADIVFNPCIEWSTTGVADTYPVGSVATHEIGHWLGLDHSSVGAATMYPFGDEYGTFSESALSPTSISGDDRCGVNGLYPDAAFTAKTGSIAGTVTRNAALLYGAQVVATRVSDGIVFGSDITRNSNQGELGEYRIDNLPPGDYHLHAEPADGPTTHPNWDKPNNNFWYDAVFPTDWETTYLGGNDSPSTVTISAGMTATPSAIAVTDGSPSDNPTLIGINDMGSVAWSGIPLTLQPSTVTTVVTVDAAGGISSGTISSVTCSDPAVTIGSVSEPFSLTPPAEMLQFTVTIPTGAVPGPRSLIFETSNGETTLLTGFLDVDGSSQETTCDDGFDDDGDGFTDCDDTECEGEEVCTDQCPGDPDKTEPGVCGCGVPDADDDDDGTLNCLDGCPDDVNKTSPGACGCGVSDADLDGDTVADCCTAGDVWPDGTGDGEVTLKDFGLAVQKALLSSVAINDNDLSCGNVAPVDSTCLGDTGPIRICPDPDADFDAEDVDVIRSLTSGTTTVSCNPCLAVRPGDDGTARRVGDVAPREAPGDGIVNVSDVLLVLNWAVDNLSPPSPGEELFLRADVAPANPSDGLLVVVGDGDLNLADVIGLLRFAVDLDQYAWPERSAEVDLSGELPTHVGFQAVTTGWPAWAENWDFVATRPTCDTTSGIDVLDDRVVVTCYGNSSSATGTTVSLRYRAPEAVDLGTIEVGVTLIESSLALTEASSSISAE